MRTTTRCTPDEFEISDEGIRHKPTGYSYAPQGKDSSSGYVNRGRLGDKLPDGRDYRPYEVEDMARQLWAAYAAGKRG